MRTRLRSMTLVAAVAVAFLLPTSGALAGSSSVTGTIALSATSRAAEPLHYGGTVSFATTVSGRMAPKGYVYVSVYCSQGGPTNVYEWSAPRDFVFPLVDQPGDGLNWPGGDASCTGTLFYRVDGARGTSQISQLSQVPFSVTA